MNRTANYQKFLTTTFYFLFLAILYFTNPKLGFSESLKEKTVGGHTAQARFAVEQAWETYHDAALGGTLASPAIQTELEMNLHKSRALLAEAYDAEDKGDAETVNKMIAEIMRINQKVITESREPKK